MGKTPMISVKAVAGLLDALEAGGGNPEEVLHVAGVGRATLADPQRYMPCAAFARLLDESARAARDECFGLHFGERYNPKDIGAVAYVVLNSPTIEAALDNAERYLHLHNESAKVFHTAEGARVYLRQVLPDFGLQSLRQHNEYSLALALNLHRLMAGSHWVPLEVQFTHESPRDTAEHARVFGCPVSFACPTNAMVIEREFLERHVPSADARLYPILKNYLDEILRAMPHEDDFLSSIRRTVADSMRDGDGRLASVAKRLALSQRTLQRKLKEYDIDFQTILDDTRRHFACEYLRDPRNTVTEVAFLLGYSEVSAFNRAFKRWTGKTPLEHRHRAVKTRRVI